MDSGTNDRQSKDRITHSAKAYGWQVDHPYKRGVEGHHWCFARKPKPHSTRTRLRVLQLRAILPRR